MSSPSFILSDAALNRALSELAAGPPADVVVSDILREIAVTPQSRGLPWPVIGGRRPMLLLATGLLVIGLAASAFVVGQMPPEPLPATIATPFPTQAMPNAGSTIVIQSWNGKLGDELAYSHTMYERGNSVGAPLQADLPPNARGLAWSPDGHHLLYFTLEYRTSSSGTKTTGLYVADEDGSGRTSVATSTDLDRYSDRGAVWSPTSDLFALSWSGHSCQSPSPDADCRPPTGIDVFDAHGQLVVAIDTGTEPRGLPLWSPDGSAIGWVTWTCDKGASLCDTAFNSRSVVAGANDNVTRVDLGTNSQVQWLASNRLQIADYSDDSEVLAAYTVATDGTDRRDIDWPHSWGRLLVSPDGTRVVGRDRETSEIVMWDVASGGGRRLDGTDSLGARGWSPESDRLVLVGNGTPLPYAAGELFGQDRFYLLDIDDLDHVQRLQDGDDYTWLPPLP